MPSRPTYPAIPRLPVLGWGTLQGKYSAKLDCLLDRQQLNYTTSGRAAILLALEMLGIEAGDQILVPTYHCPTMVAPIVALGAQPIFYPINDSGGADLGWLEAVRGSSIKAILVAHYFGRPQAMRQLRQWSDRRQLALIEDCAHALFGQTEGRAIGSWGDVAIASLTKFLPVPEGGCLVRNDAQLQMPSQNAPGAVNQIKAALDMVQLGAMFKRFQGLNPLLQGVFSLINGPRRQLRAIRQNGEPASLASPALEGFSIDIGLSHRSLTQPCRWVARHSPRDRIVAGRRRNYQRMLTAFTGYPGLHPLYADLPEHSAPYVFPLWIAEPDPGYLALRQAGIPLSRWDRPWHDMPIIDKDQGRDWSHHVLQLPCHQDLSLAEVDLLIAAILQTYG